MNMREDTSDSLEPAVLDALCDMHTPPKPRLEEAWEGIESRHFTLPAAHSRREWFTRPWLAAATLVIGLALGHFGTALKSGHEATLPSLTNQDPFVISTGTPAVKQTTHHYFGQTAALLATLPGASRMNQKAVARQVELQFAAQATELLATTRQLLDSPGAQSPELQDLLSDLELVLAQVAGLPGSHTRQEVDLIEKALKQRGVMTRLQAAVVQTAL